MATEVSSNIYRLDLFTLVNGSGKSSSPNHIMQDLATGESMVAPTKLTSANFGGETGQVALMVPLKQARQLLISDLRCLTSVTGPSIREAAWQRDDDPYFYWHIDVEPESTIKGFSIAMDKTPDDTIDIYSDYYQYAEDGLLSGKHTFYVIPIIASGPSVEDTLKFELWVDRDTPVISNTQPPAGSLTANPQTKISCYLADQDSGMDLGSTTLAINGSNGYYHYDGSTGALEFTPIGLSEGTNTVLLTAYDKVGNSLAKGWDFLVDTQPPSGGILINNGAVFTPSAHVFLNISASDAVSGIRNIYISNDGVFDTELAAGRPYKPVIADWFLSDPEVDGIKKVYLKFDDSAGNLSGNYSDTIELRLLTPDTKIVSGPANLTAETTAGFRFEATKPNCKFSWRLDNQEWQPWSEVSSVDFEGLSVGNHYFYVKSALDLNGDTEFGIDEEDPAPAQWVWTITTEQEAGKLRRKTLFWRR